MRVIIARAGLTTPIIWSLSLFCCSIILWLPDDFLSLPIKLAFSILSLTIVFSLASSLPPQRIIFALDSCVLISTAMQLRTKDVALIRFTEHGRTVGYYVDLYSHHETFPKLEVRVDILKDKNNFEKILVYAFPTATIKYGRSLWGNSLDFLVGIFGAVCLTGLAKLILESI